MDWTLTASKSQPGKFYYFNSRTGKSLWHDSELPKGFAYEIKPNGDKQYVNLQTGSTSIDKPQSNLTFMPSAGTKRPREHDLNVSATDAAPTLTSGSEKMAHVRIALQALIFDDSRGILARAPLYLHADAATDTVSLTPTPTPLYVTSLDAHSSPIDALADGSECIALASSIPGSATCAWIHASADDTRVLCRPSMQLPSIDAMPAPADITDAAAPAARHDIWRVLRGTFSSCGAQVLALTTINTSLLMCVTRSREHAHAAAPAAAWKVGLARTTVASTAKSIVDSVLSGACVAEDASSVTDALLFAVICEDDLSPYVLAGLPSSAAAAPSALSRMIYSSLGVPIPSSSCALGGGMRARVYRCAYEAPPATLIVKVQPMDARVESELRVCEAVSRARMAGRASRLIFPLALHVDHTNAYMIMPDAGICLSDIIAPKGSPLSPLLPSVVRVIVTAIAEALAALHALGYLYCDLHAGNVCVPASNVRHRASRSTESETWSDVDSPRVTTKTARDTVFTPWAWDDLCIIDLGSAVPLGRARASSSMPPAPSGTAAPPPLSRSGSTLTSTSESVRVGLEYRGPTRGGKWTSMPPEQFGPGAYAAGEVILTPSSDVYALCTLGIHCLTGEEAFALPAGTKVTVAATRAHTRRDPSLMRMHVTKAIAKTTRSTVVAGAASGESAISEDARNLLDILLRGMDPTPSRRYTTMEELLTALRSV